MKPVVALGFVVVRQLLSGIGVFQRGVGADQRIAERVGVTVGYWVQ